jgi:hypothetical protein
MENDWQTGVKKNRFGFLEMSGRKKPLTFALSIWVFNRPTTGELIP